MIDLLEICSAVNAHCIKFISADFSCISNSHILHSSAYLRRYVETDGNLGLSSELGGQHVK